MVRVGDPCEILPHLALVYIIIIKIIIIITIIIIIFIITDICKAPFL